MDMERRDSPEDVAVAGEDPPKIGVLDLFRAFMIIGASGFGGTLPFVRMMLVERRRWMGAAEFTEVLGLSQLLPGPNVVNITIYVGSRFAGIRGAVAAFGGLMLIPMITVLCLAVLYGRYGDLQSVQHAFTGISAAAAGLVVATAAKIAWPVLRSPRTIVVALAIFVAMAVAKVPLVVALAIVAPVSVLWTWWTFR
jgi:chromate transporter